MGRFVVGDVVIASFPYSNLKGSKLRPALILATGEFGDVILCQVTSKAYSSRRAVRLEPINFSDGRLSFVSYARPDKLFTCDTSIVNRKVGHITDKLTSQVLEQVRELFDTKIEIILSKVLPVTRSSLLL